LAAIVSLKRYVSWNTNATDPAALRVVEARDEVDHRRLARAGRSDDGDDRAAGGAETHVPQHRLVRRVAEGHVVEHDFTHTPGRQRSRARFLGHGRLGVEHFIQPPRADDRVLVLLVDRRDLLEAAEDRAHRRAEDQHVACRQLALQQQHAAREE
jgi:hypothetical protein